VFPLQVKEPSLLFKFPFKVCQNNASKSLTKICRGGLIQSFNIHPQIILTRPPPPENLALIDFNGTWGGGLIEIIGKD
jgi:hypothetical protein